MMWHEVALTGVSAICLRSKVNTPVSAPIRAGLCSRGSDSTSLCSAQKSAVQRRAGSRWGALAQALPSTGRAGVPVTVRIRAVSLRLSSGGKGPDLARTGSDGVAEGHKRQAAARVWAAFSSRSTARALASAEARLFRRIHDPGPLVHLDLRRAHKSGSADG
jgi:hypothetical protein